MSEIISGNDGPFGQREPAGGRPAIAFIVIIVAMLASGVFSSDPEVDSAPGAAPLAPVGATEGPGDGSAAVVDDQVDFVEFGFDSRLGVITPRGEPVVEVPAFHPGDASSPARQM